MADEKKPRRKPGKAQVGTGDTAYDAKKKAAAERSRNIAASGREIGTPPPVVNPRRKERARRDLRNFCEVYLAARFPLAWGRDHGRAIEKLQICGVEGGRFAFAMPRGSGKTTLAESAALWALLYGHRRFVVLVGATDPAAVDILDSIKVELETNDLLFEDFPEVCFPIRALEGIANRANGQTSGGVRTRIGWTQNEVVLPTIKDSVASGAVLRVAGITGRIRGMKATRSDGTQIRPDLVIPDDPQTDESAGSPTQNAAREKVLTGAILGLAGPKRKIAVVMPCTVIETGDLADRMLDRGRNPSWQGERWKMVYSFPTAVELWERYAEIRRDGLRAEDGGRAATEFYRANRAAMDAGASVGWEERFNDDELSAIQHAQNLRIDNPRSFAAEAQNEPLAESGPAASRAMVADVIAKRISGIPRFVVPRECSRLTAFVDVGGEILWYLVAAWSETFGGSVVDYGSWPRQTRNYFTSADARPNLSEQYPGMTEPQRVFAGLRDLTGEILGRVYLRHEIGEPVRVDRCLIDAGWLPDTVRGFARASPHAATILTSKGHAAGSTARPISEWRRNPGDLAGPDWRVTSLSTGRGRIAIFDPDAWKSFVADRLATPEGGGGALTLFSPAAGGHHQLFADHVSAETASRITARGRTYDKWTVRPGRDNHWLDCLVGAAVAASILGVRWSDGAEPTKPVSAKAKPRPLSEVQRERQLEAARQGRNYGC